MNKRLIIALAALLAAGAFWDGLYAPGQQLLVTAAFAVAALLLRAGARLDRTEVAGLALLTLGVAGSLWHPVAAGYAAHGPVIAAGWVLALLTGRALAAQEAAGQVFGRAFAGLATLMVFGGLAAISYVPAHHSGRLAAFLGYPVAVGALGLLGLAGSLPLLKAGSFTAPALACGSALAVWLSGSRGVWAAGALLALYLFRMRPALLPRAVWPVAAALAAALWAGPAVALRQPFPALMAGLTAGLTSLALARFQRRWILWAGAGAWLAAAVAAPGWGWFLGRATALSLTEGSSVERVTFLRDGLAMAARLPLGAGYKAWSALQLTGASYGYYSAEAHSAVVDLALAFGWAGVAGFVLLLGCFVWRVVRDGRTWSDERLAWLGGVAVVGLHSLVDWDLSYGLFAAVLWFGMGLAGDGGGQATPQWRLPAALASLALAASLLLGGGDLFTAAAQRSLAAGAPGRAAQHATVATGVSPWSDQAWAALGQAEAGLGQHAAAVAALGRARALGPREPWYAQLQADDLVQARRWREAAAAYRDLTRLWPWEVSAYETALDRISDLAQRAVLQGEMDLARDLIGTGRAILVALDRQKALEPPGRPRKPINVQTPGLERARAFFHQ